jgi:acyl-CoA synthetase (AMP-forming)/AMP-acid ligase II
VPGVRSAAVLVPAAGRPAATLVVVAELTAHEVLAGLRGELEDFKVPRQCVVVDELPVTGNGKVDRTALADLVREGSDV